MPMEVREHPKVWVSIDPCPECHESCGWCAWYRHQARERGCGCPPPPGSRKRKPYATAEALKGTSCGTCDGSGKVRVRHEILTAGDQPAADSPMPGRMAALLEDLVQRAVARQRCPDVGTLRLMGHVNPSATMRELAQAGKIQVEVSGRNWRVVEILVGPRKGARTKEDPTGSKPHIVIDSSGRRDIES